MTTTNNEREHPRAPTFSGRSS